MTQQVVGYLKPIIKEYVDARRESLRWFSRQTGVDATTIYRLVDGEQKSLSFSNAVRILKYVDPQSYLSILSDFYPFEARELSKVSPDKAEELLSILAADPYLYRVFAFAAEKKANRDEVQRKFGEDGLLQLERLLKFEILSNSDNRMIDNLKGMSYPSEDTAKRIAMHSYALTSLATPGSLLENFRAAVTAEAVRGIYQVGKEYREKVHQIIDSNKGDIIISGSLISGPME